jgi:hypothetical protein
MTITLMVSYDGSTKRAVVTKSTTWIANTSALLTDEALAPFLARLVLSVNDLSLAADAFETWTATELSKRVTRKRGAQMYFIRVLLGHVFEALLIIEQMAEVPAVLRRVERCHPRTVELFQKLSKLRDTKQWRQLNIFRNRVSFHYDRVLPKAALVEILANFPEHQFSYSMGDEPIDWQFEIADMMIDHIVIRNAFSAGPRRPERKALVEEIAFRLQEISHQTTEFSAHFVRECIRP